MLAVIWLVGIARTLSATGEKFDAGVSVAPGTLFD